MGKRDNRRSMKMRRKVAQKKLKARIKRRKSERQAAKAPPAGKAKKARTPAKDAARE